MIDHSRLSFLAERASERYLLVLQSLRGILAQALNRPDPSASALRSFIREEAIRIAEVFLESEHREIIANMQSIACLASADAFRSLGADVVRNESSGAVVELLDAQEKYLLSEIAVQLERDIAGLLKHWHMAALQIHRLERLYRLSREAAIARFRISEQQKLKFWFKDRHGRRYPSQKYVRTVMRGALLDLAVNAFLGVMADAGVSQLAVIHQDTKHSYFGLTVSVVDDGVDPFIEDVRDDVFHPNSEAWLTPV